MSLYLGIESSCDETATAIYDADRGLLCHRIHSQIELHACYGGVVPELAARDHCLKIIPLIDDVIQAAQLPSIASLSGIAYTRGPGLIGALLVGATVARSLGFALQIPTLGIHHLEAHLMAVMLEAQRPEFPFLALLVSGGHTQLLRVDGLGHYQLLGETLDDAVGEAFDKVAKWMGLPYPGGRVIEQYAKQGNAARFTGRWAFPRPMTDRPGLDFSFSGLKTHTIQCYQTIEQEPTAIADIACAFQEAVMDTLYIKCKRALKQTGLSRLVIVGGVGANQQLRMRLTELMSICKEGQLFYPRSEFCTDNAAMVAYLGCMRMGRGERDDALAIKPLARWELS